MPPDVVDNIVVAGFTDVICTVVWAEVGGCMVEVEACVVSSGKIVVGVFCVVDVVDEKLVDTNGVVAEVVLSVVATVDTTVVDGLVVTADVVACMVDMVVCGRIVVEEIPSVSIVVACVVNTDGG